MTAKKWLGFTLLTAVFALTSAPGPASGAVDKCQKQIETIGRAFKDQVYKAIQFCKDTYRAEVAKALAAAQKAGDPNVFASTLQLNLEKKAPVCGKKLESVLGTPNGLGGIAQKTQAEKAYKKLNDLVVKGICSDCDLFALGHLVPAGWGDAWIRALLVAELKWAYEQELSHVADLPAVFSALIDPDAGGPPDCTGVLEPTRNYCAVLATPPCQSLTCTLNSTSSEVNNDVCALSGVLTGSLSGTFIQEYCQFPPWTGCDLFVIGAPARGIAPTTLNPLSVATLCPANVRTMGFVKGPGTCTIDYGPAGGPATTSFTVSSVISPTSPKDISICESTGAGCPLGLLSCPVAPSCASISSAPGCAKSALPPPLQISFGPGTVAQGDSVLAAQMQILTVVPAGSCTQGAATNMDSLSLVLTTGTSAATVNGAWGNACGSDPPNSCDDSKSITGSGSTFASLAPNSVGSPGNYLDGSDLANGCVTGSVANACHPSGSLVSNWKLCCQ